jgi:Icc-related predicted phosphoesterase
VRGRFAVVSDLQRTSRLELWRESNPRERERILRRIGEESPDFVAMLGDLVFRGSSASDWSEFDRLTGPLTRARIPMFPILGNHEYWVSSRLALPNYFSQFHGRRWYAGSYGPLALLFLDSNRSRMPRVEWKAQIDWYTSALQAAQDDPAVRGILVFVHHPPYTNSTVTSDTIPVQRSIVPPFVAAGKTMAMLSGHVHSYERFERAGKVFLVSGGGGGPRVRLSTGDRRRHTDDLFSGPPVRHLHFLSISLEEEGLVVSKQALPKGGEEFKADDSFLLRWPAGRQR